MAKRNTKSKSDDKGMVAAIAAVHLAMSGEKSGSAAVRYAAGTGREGWKMAGRAERLGLLNASDKPFTGRVKN